MRCSVIGCALARTGVRYHTVWPNGSVQALHNITACRGSRDEAGCGGCGVVTCTRCAPSGISLSDMHVRSTDTRHNMYTIQSVGRPRRPRGRCRTAA
eukprot:7389109-Prymnesium_polylepis.3